MGSHEASYDGGVPVYLAVVEAVAAERGVDPLSLKPPLYEVLDPEALDALCDRPKRTGAPVRITFSYAGCTVIVDTNGSIVVDC